MTLRYTILASGSSGNASLIQTAAAGILLDAGIGPQDLAERISQSGYSPECVQGMLLTHTHTDHWKDRTLAWLLRRCQPLYCHPGHHAVLTRTSEAFRQMLEANLVRSFAPGVPFSPVLGMTVCPFAVRHDSGATFGFRVEGPADLLGRRAAIGYASDLGTWGKETVEALTDIDLLALEFNHDLDLERASTRPAMLVSRVLSDEGHLSNAQAADLVRAVLERSTPGRLRHLVQLHLSRDCNRPALARKAATEVLQEMNSETRVHTAEQQTPGKTIRLDPAAEPKLRRTRTPNVPVVRAISQGWLPGLGPMGETQADRER